MSVEAMERPASSSFLDRFKSRQLALGLGSVLTGLLIWEIFARFILKNPFFLAPPSEVIRVLIALFAGPIYPHLAISSLEFIIGIGLGAFVGVALGVSMALSASVRHVLDPWISALYSMPTVALAPLFILWFGIGIWSKVAVVFLVTFVPILVNTSVGIKGADTRLIEATRAFGGTLYHEVLFVRLPWAIPSIIAGLRLAVGRGLVGIVVGELFGAREGIGFLIFDASQRFDSATLLATVIVLSIVGVISVYALEALERRVGGWQGVS
jgi:NitT/TauT family transport system permease protein